MCFMCRISDKQDEGRILVVNSEFWGQPWHSWRLYIKGRKNDEMKTKAGVSCDRTSEIVYRQNKTDFHAGCSTKLNILCADFCGVDVSHRHHSVSHHSANCVLQVKQQLRQFLCEYSKITGSRTRLWGMPLLRSIFLAKVFLLLIFSVFFVCVFVCV